MSYKHLINYYCADRDIMTANIYSTMESMGWTLVDTGNLYGGVSTNPIARVSCTFAGTDTITLGSATNLAVNSIVCFGSYTTTATAPTGMTLYTGYYVHTVIDSTHIKVKNTYAGSAITLTGGTSVYMREKYRVYTSTGELGDRIPEFIVFDNTGDNQLAMKCAYKWDATHAAIQTLPPGAAWAFQHQIISYVNPGYTNNLWVYGNKDLIAIITKYTTTYTGPIMAGHMPKRMYNNTTALTNGCSASPSTPITIDIGSSTGYVIGAYYLIVGSAMEGREKVTITAIPSSTQLTLASISRSYAANSLIGSVPSTFCNLGGTSGSQTCNAHANSTPLYEWQDATYASIQQSNITYSASLKPDFAGGEQLYGLSPAVFYDTSYNASTTEGGLFAYSDDYFLLSPMNGTGSNEDTFGVTQRDTGTASASSSATTLVDSTKSWATDTFAGKVVIITGGTGAGQIRKITSNIGTTLSPSTNFTTIPDATSTYVICDYAYRFFLNSPYWVFREGV